MNLFSERLVERMKELQVRQVDLVTATKASKGTVSKWINHNAVPETKFLLPLASYLRVTPIWLSSGKGPKDEDLTTVPTIPASNEVNHVQVDHFDVIAAMGGGCVPPDYAEVITRMTFTKEFLAKMGSSFTSTTNLAMVTGWGSSMSGTINHGDSILVDRGVTQFVGDGVYLFTWDGLLYLKRLQKESKEKFSVISDSDKYQAFLVPIEEVIVHARAILVWGAKAL